MDLPQKQFLFSKASVIGLFAFLSLVLTIPLVILLSQERQTMTGRAAVETSSQIIKTQIIPPSKVSNIIFGYVYNDTNKNGERDPQEQPVPNLSIQITQLKPEATSGQINPNIVTTVATDMNGYFKFKFTNLAPDTSSFLVKLILPPGYKTINSNPLILSDLKQNDRNVVQFGIFSHAIVPTVPSPVLSEPTCAPRPACLDFVPRCMLSEPIGGWCPKTTINSLTSSPSSKLIKGD